MRPWIVVVALVLSAAARASDADVARAAAPDDTIAPALRVAGVDAPASDADVARALAHAPRLADVVALRASSVALAAALASAHDEDGKAPAAKTPDVADARAANAAPADSGGDDDGHTSKLDKTVDDLFAGRWLDPQDPYWRPRRGERFELSVLIGGEAAFSAVEASTKLPSIGGMVLNGVARYYPVDRLAVVFGGRTYVGLDGVPAAGTTASSVASLITGVRYDLVRENRFSLLWDLYSGPSLYVFAALPSVSTTAVALGGEMGSALALRYSVGPFTGEARGVVGGRAGASSTPFQRAGDAGPFSALYAGFDLGVTWSVQ